MAPLLRPIARRFLDDPLLAERVTQLPPSKAALLYAAALGVPGSSDDRQKPEVLCRLILERSGLQGTARSILTNRATAVDLAALPNFVAYPQRYIQTQPTYAADLSKEKLTLQQELLSLLGAPS